MTKEEILNTLLGDEVYEQIKSVLENSETLVNRIDKLEQKIEDLEYEKSDLEYQVNERPTDLSDFGIKDMIHHLENKGYTVQENSNITLDNVDVSRLENIIAMYYDGSFEEREAIYKRVKGI